MRSQSPETHKDPGEVDDQFRSLMEGLRTTIPGVMVLFSFLHRLDPLLCDLSQEWERHGPTGQQCVVEALDIE